jgi:hypothetical protein
MRQEDNIKIDVRGIGRENGMCMELTQDYVQRQVWILTVSNERIDIKQY